MLDMSENNLATWASKKTPYLTYSERKAEVSWFTCCASQGGLGQGHSTMVYNSPQYFLILLPNLFYVVSSQVYKLNRCHIN